MVRICPKCGSTDIMVDHSTIVGIMPVVYVCNNCGTTAAFFPDVDRADIEKFRNKINKKTQQ